MRLESLSRIVARLIFFTFLAATLFTSLSNAQDTPQPQDDQQPPDARPMQQDQNSAQQPPPAQRRDAQEEVQVLFHELSRGFNR